MKAGLGNINDAWVLHPQYPAGCQSLICFKCLNSFNYSLNLLVKFRALINYCLRNPLSSFDIAKYQN